MAILNPPASTMTVVLNTAQSANSPGVTVRHPVGSVLPVQRTAAGKAYVEIHELLAAEVLVLSNQPEAEGSILNPLETPDE